MIPPVPRSHLLLAAFAMILVVGVAAYDLMPPPLLLAGAVVPADDAPTLERRARDAAIALIHHQDTARPDGYTYTVDMGQILIYAARARDRFLYNAARDWCVGHVIVNQPDDPLAHGMVAWRFRPDSPLDASGTTEALRVARGLWEGARHLNIPEDRQLALTIIRAYARHADVDQNIWMIRNYFNLQTRSFATNSYLVDYDPDLLDDMAFSATDARLADLARKSYDLIRKAQTRTGLIYDLVQPEVRTLMYDDSAVFSPNGIVRLANALSVAEWAAGGAPEVGRRLLRFCDRHRFGLRTQYHVATGQPAVIAPADWSALAVQLRLAQRLGDRAALHRLRPAVLLGAQRRLDNLPQPRLYTLSEILLTTQAIELAQR